MVSLKFQEVVEMYAEYSNIALTAGLYNQMREVRRMELGEWSGNPKQMHMRGFLIGLFVDPLARPKDRSLVMNCISPECGEGEELGRQARDQLEARDCPD